MEKILVTGAGGYIGTTLVPTLLEAGFSVRAIDRYFFGQDLLPTHPNLEKIKEDTRHLAPHHFKGIDGVIDLAAVSNDPSGELFQDATWQINHVARVHTAQLAKNAGVKRYILPSSCSLYGFQAHDVVANEQSKTNPLTTYAKANEKAEQGAKALADENFCVVILRQATVYGYSPRMRFDLAVNGMTYGAWKTKTLPLMRDGKQWRPMVHVSDTAVAQIFMLTAPAEKVNGEVFNVGSDRNVYRLADLGDLVARTVSPAVKIEWYGDIDHRSYRVNFDKIEALGWKAKKTAEDGVKEIVAVLDSGKLDKTTETLTLDWYAALKHWKEIIDNVSLYGGILEIEPDAVEAAPRMKAVGK